MVWLPDSQLRPNARVVRPSSVGWSQGDLRGAISAATAMSRATADEAKKAHRWERRPWHRAERTDRGYLVIIEQQPRSRSVKPGHAHGIQEVQGENMRAGDAK